MKELVTKDLTTTSMQIAELFGREHKNVLRIIRGVVKDMNDDDLHQLKIEPLQMIVSVGNGGSKEIDYFKLGEEMTLIITGRLTGKNALVAQMKLARAFIEMRNFIRNHQSESLRLTNDNLIKLQEEYNVVKINPNCAKSILKERNNKLVNELPVIAIEMGLITSSTETTSITRYYPTPLGTELGLTMTNHTINYPESLHACLKSEVAVKRWLRARMKQIDIF